MPTEAEEGMIFYVNEPNKLYDAEKFIYDLI